MPALLNKLIKIYQRTGQKLGFTLDQGNGPPVTGPGRFPASEHPMAMTGIEGHTGNNQILLQAGQSAQADGGRAGSESVIHTDANKIQYRATHPRSSSLLGTGLASKLL